MTKAKSTSELLFEIVGETGDERLAEIANEVEYLETASTNLLKLIFQINTATTEIIERATEEMKLAFSPERYAAFEAEAGAAVQTSRVNASLEALPADLQQAGLVEDVTDENLVDERVEE